MTVDDAGLARLPGLIRIEHPMRDLAGEVDIGQPWIVNRVADHRRLGAVEMLEAFTPDHEKLRVEATRREAPRPFVPRI